MPNNVHKYIHICVKSGDIPMHSYRGVDCMHRLFLDVTVFARESPGRVTETLESEVKGTLAFYYKHSYTICIFIIYMYEFFVTKTVFFFKKREGRSEKRMQRQQQHISTVQMNNSHCFTEC